MQRLPLGFAVLAAFAAAAAAQSEAFFAARGPALEALYVHLHQHPELSFKETQTAARMAQELRALGLDVTENVGGTGVVAVLRRGDGPVVLVRADMDALPVAEETGLPYASKVRAESADGRAIGVMHACGHDLHMTCLVGAAQWFAQEESSWRGTLVFQLQPAEERAGGMKAMLKDGLLTRFPRPQAAIALHTAHDLANDQVGIRTGYAMANVDNVDITLVGKGGHGAAPHLTIDPVTMGAQLVLDLQTIVAREVDPIDPCLITVGSFQAGNKHNITPDRCHLQATMRSYSPAARDKMMAAVVRKAKAVAASFGAPEPVVEFSEPTPALRNDAQLTETVRQGLVAAFGAGRVAEVPPAMVAEDFGRLDGEKIPLCMFRVGTVAPERLLRMQAAGDVPALHSARFYPDYAVAIRTGVRGLVAAARAAGGQGR
jgi:amidohydrolase